MDLLLGYTPWVNGTDFCNLKRQGLLDDQIAQKRPEEKEYVKKEGTTFKHGTGQNTPKQLTRFEGRYGNYAYGNLTVYINQTSSNLMLRYGAALWEMIETSPGEFTGPGLDPFWYWTLDVVFEDGDPSPGVTVLFEAQPSIPFFERDLDVDNNLPPPPSTCPQQ